MISKFFFFCKKRGCKRERSPSWRLDIFLSTFLRHQLDTLFFFCSDKSLSRLQYFFLLFPSKNEWPTFSLSSFVQIFFSSFLEGEVSYIPHRRLPFGAHTHKKGQRTLFSRHWGVEYLPTTLSSILWDLGLGNTIPKHTHTHNHSSSPPSLRAATREYIPLPPPQCTRQTCVSAATK